MALCLAAACSSSTKGGKGSGKPGEEWQGESRDTTITHEPCEPAGKEVRTFLGDSNLASGKSYVKRLYEGGREVCSFADLNGDGNVDVFTYFGPDGRIRRRESAYTVSNAIDEIAIFEGGDLKVVMRETNFDGKLDTWDYYEGGKLAKRERDKTGDGRIDEWWTFQPPGSENATVVQADTRTGKPDPTQTLMLGAGGSVVSSFGAATPSASAKPSASATPDAGPPETGLSPMSTDMPTAAPDAGAASKDAGTSKKGGK
ncbi:MAG: hypothetical protein ACXVEE_08695 [Polyangiales bacterium]